MKGAFNGYIWKTGYSSAWRQPGKCVYDLLAEIRYLVNHSRLLFLWGCSSPHQWWGGKTVGSSLRCNICHQSSTTHTISTSVFQFPPHPPLFLSFPLVWQQPSIPVCSNIVIKQWWKTDMVWSKYPSAPSVGFFFDSWTEVPLALCGLNNADFAHLFIWNWFLKTKKKNVC